MAYLSSFTAIRSHLLIKIRIPEYRVLATDGYSDTTITFSDLNRDNSFIYDGNTYTGLGGLMSVTASNSELRPTSSELTITVAGIPNTSISSVINSKIKGASVWIYRVLFDPVNGTPLDLDQGNPFARFRGFVNNYTLTEEYDVQSRTSTNTIQFICKSSLDVLQNKVNGRLTNPISQKKFYPDDVSMDRVPALQNISFNFGAPKE